MRKLANLTLSAALALAACGDTGKKVSSTDRRVDNARAGGDAGLTIPGDDSLALPDASSAGGGEFADCPRQDIRTTFPEYAGEAVWTLTDYQACVDMCGSDDACWTSNCPGSDLFTQCVNTQIFGCSGSSTGGCRSEYEDSVCCSAGAGCASTDSTCISDNCSDYIEKFVNCAVEDMTCASAVQKCVKPEASAAPTPTAAMVLRAARLSLPASMGSAWVPAAPVQRAP